MLVQKVKSIKYQKNKKVTEYDDFLMLARYIQQDGRYKNEKVAPGVYLQLTYQSKTLSIAFWFLNMHY